MDAILEATVQVLTAVGKERLTTTRVAERAGVSVGTLYQYFPHKSSLLQAALRRHFAHVTAAIERACREHRGLPLVEMGSALAECFLNAKIADGKTGSALYAVSSDVDGIEIAQEVARITHAAIADLLRTAPDSRGCDVNLMTTVLQGLMSGVSRQLLESSAPQQNLEAFRRELVHAVRGYLERCAR